MLIYPLFLAFILNAMALQPRLNVTDLVTLSDRITVAYVSGTETRWAPGPEGGLETVIWLSPSHHLKGAPTESIEVLVHGGRLGDYETWVEDEASLYENHRYLLFLHQTAAGEWRVLAGPQGAVELRSVKNPDAVPLKSLMRQLGGPHAD